MERSHGGRRAGAGRKRLAPDLLQRKDVRLTDEMIRYCEKAGGGDFSYGVRLIITGAMTTDAQAKGDKPLALRNLDNRNK